MQSAPFFVFRKGAQIFSCCPVEGNRRYNFPGGDATGRRECENMETIREEAAVWSC